MTNTSNEADLHSLRICHGRCQRDPMCSVKVATMPGRRYPREERVLALGDDRRDLHVSPSSSNASAHVIYSSSRSDPQTPTGRAAARTWTPRFRRITNDPCDVSELRRPPVWTSGRTVTPSSRSRHCSRYLLTTTSSRVASCDG